MRDFLAIVIGFFDEGIIWYFLAVNSFYALLLFLSIPEIWKHWKVVHHEDLRSYLGLEALPPISVIIPAYDMAASIIHSVDAQLALEYPQFEVIVVDDGSKDDTFSQLREAYDLYEVPPAFPAQLTTQPVGAYYRSRTRPHLLVVEKANGGKADALNAGLNAARYPLVVAVDADTIVARDALLRLARPFLLGENVAAAGGTIRVANGAKIVGGQVVDARIPRRFLAAVQVPEYLRAFLFGRLGWNRMGGNLIVSGAFGLFQRPYLLAIGGYRAGNVVEDLDLVVRLHQHLRTNKIPYDIPFVPDPVAWTEVPSDVRSHRRQRARWHRGLVVTMAQHWKMLFNRKYGIIGFVTVPFYVFGEMIAPVVEVFGYVLTIVGLTFGLIDTQYALLFLTAAIGYQMFLSIWAVVLEETTFKLYDHPGDFARMLGYAIAEPFGYRQLTVLWRLQGFWQAVRGRKHWGAMKRKGFKARMWFSFALALALGSLARTAAAQDVDPCRTADTVVEAGWERFRVSDVNAAGDLFAQALQGCPTHIGAAVGAGFVALRSGDLAAAEARFRSVLDRDSTDVDSWVGLGVVAWQRDDLDVARSRLDRALALDPGNAEAQSYLDQIAIEALPAGPVVVDSAVILAQLRGRASDHTAAERYGSAAAVYDTIVRAFPDERDAPRSLARVLAWDGQYDSAMVVYERVITNDANDVEARKGLARTVGWSGDHVASETLWLALVADYPDDAEAQLGLAQVRRWQGRLDAADSALGNAERLTPDDPLVQQERLALNTSRAASTNPFVTFETDSDGNDITTVLLAAGARVNQRTFLTGRIVFRSALNDNSAADAVTSTTASVDGIYDLSTDWSLRAGLGLNTSSGTAANRPVLRAGATGPVWNTITPRLDFRHEPLDITARLITNGVYFDELALTGIAEPAAWDVIGSYGFALFHGSETNTRHMLTGLALRDVWGDFTAGGRLRLFSFAKNLNDGYFDPSLYFLLEVPIQWSRQFGDWLIFGEVNPGFQVIDTDVTAANSQVTIGGNARITYSVARGRDLGVMALASRSGLQTLAVPTDGYRYYMIGAFGSWSF